MEVVIRILNRSLIMMGGVLLTAMIGLTCANIFLRSIYAPIAGTYELMGYFGAAVTAFALGYTQLTKGHIAVEVLVHTFPKSVVRLLTLTNHLACALFFGVLSWQLADRGIVLLETGEVTETLRIVYYPFIWAVALGCAFLALVGLFEGVRIGVHGKERKA